MSRRAPRFAFAFVASIIVLAAFAGSALAVDKFVTMYASEFLPRTVTINAGDKVTWVNDDDVAHDAVGSGWSTSILQQYDQDSVRFNRAGTYRYICSIHPTMRGTVVVRGAGSGGVTPDTATESRDLERDGGGLGSALAFLAGIAIAATVVIDRLLRRRPVSRG
jgi:plastocyanin